MKRLIGAAICFAAAGVLFGGWWLSRPTSPPEPETASECKIVPPPLPKKKPSCASCGDARHPTPPLALEEYDRLLVQYSREPIDASDALDALCFYGVQARAMIETHGTGGLDPERAAFLRRETSRTHAYLSVRVIDEHGVLRVSMMRKKVAFDQRSHHAVDEVVDVEPPEISGTVKRVGLYHIWARF